MESGARYKSQSDRDVTGFCSQRDTLAAWQLGVDPRMSRLRSISAQRDEIRGLLRRLLATAAFASSPSTGPAHDRFLFPATKKRCGSRKLAIGLLIKKHVHDH